MQCDLQEFNEQERPKEKTCKQTQLHKKSQI